jgi:pimeloyl-ACP methyl ester carboxylesterase
MSHKKNRKKIPVKIPLVFRLLHSIFPFLERFLTPIANKLTAYIFFHPMRFKAPEAEEDAAKKAEKGWVRVASKKVRIYSWGDGPAVLMTHGWSGRGTQFRKFIKPLNKAGYRVVSFDGPAHGRSEGRSTNVTEFNEVIQQLESQYGPFECTIGHSFGGVANLFAYTREVKTKRMIMISTPTISKDIIDVFLDKLGASEKRGEYLEKYIIERFGVEFQDVSALKLIEGVNGMPLLLIHDVNDREVSIKHPQKLMERYPEARLISTEGLGHIRILRSPEVINHCLEYIKKPDGSINTGGDPNAQNLGATA